MSEGREDLSLLDEWFGRIIAGLEPAQRQKAALKLGQALRRSNLARIAANLDADGGAFEPRKPRKDRRGKLRNRQRGRMFKGMRLARNWKIDADANGVEIGPVSGNVDRVGAISQFGEVAIVGYLRSGRAIRYKYPVRGLAGFSDADRQLSIDIAAELLEPKH